MSAPLPTILFFYDAVYPAQHGGVEHRNHRLAEALAADDRRVLVAGWTHPAHIDHAFEFRPLGRPGRLHTRRGRRRFTAALRLAWQALRVDLDDVDVVETANIPYLHVAPLAWRCRRRRIPLIVTWHEFLGDHWRHYLRAPLVWRAARWIEHRTAHRGDIPLAVSASTASRVGAARGEAVPLVPNGVDATHLERIAAEAKRDGSPLVTAGRLVRHKRVDVLIDAAAALAGDVEGTILTIIGAGPDRARLEQHARQRDIAARVDFVGDVARADDVWRLVARSRIAVTASEQEGFGLFALEAMALGLPVIHGIASRSAVGDLVRHGVDGAAAPASGAGIADAVRELLADRARLERMGQAAQARATSYDWAMSAAWLAATIDAATGRGSTE